MIQDDPIPIVDQSSLISDVCVCVCVYVCVCMCVCAGEEGERGLKICNLTVTMLMINMWFLSLYLVIVLVN